MHYVSDVPRISLGAGQVGLSFLEAMVSAQPHLYAPDNVDFFVSHPYPFSGARWGTVKALTGLTYYRNETRCLGRPADIPVVIAETGWRRDLGVSVVWIVPFSLFWRVVNCLLRFIVWCSKHPRSSRYFALSVKQSIVWLRTEHPGRVHKHRAMDVHSVRGIDDCALPLRWTCASLTIWYWVNAKCVRSSVDNARQKLTVYVCVPVYNHISDDDCANWTALAFSHIWNPNPQVLGVCTRYFFVEVRFIAGARGRILPNVMLGI